MKRFAEMTEAERNDLTAAALGRIGLMPVGASVAFVVFDEDHVALAGSGGSHSATANALRVAADSLDQGEAFEWPGKGKAG